EDVIHALKLLLGMGGNEVEILVCSPANRVRRRDVLVQQIYRRRRKINGGNVVCEKERGIRGSLWMHNPILPRQGKWRCSSQSPGASKITPPLRRSEDL